MLFVYIAICGAVMNKMYHACVIILCYMTVFLISYYDMWCDLVSLWPVDVFVTTRKRSRATNAVDGSTGPVAVSKNSLHPVTTGSAIIGALTAHHKPKNWLMFLFTA